MNRGLAGFVAFVALILVALAGFALYIGPNGWAFLWHDERKTAPFVMVNLLDFTDAAAEMRYLRGYADPALAMIQAVGGSLLWEGRVDRVIDGRSRDRWPLVALVAYPSRAAYIDLVTSSEYRALTDSRDDALSRAAMLAGTPRSEFKGTGRAFAMRLVLGESADWRSRYDAQWLSEDTSLLERHGGRLAWRAALESVAGEDDDAFDELFLYAFADVGQRTRWAEDLELLTVQGLERRLFRRDVMFFMSALPTAETPAPTSRPPSESSDNGELAALSAPAGVPK